MEAGSSSGVDAAACGVEPGTVMYVAALNCDAPEYATAVENNALYSVVNRENNTANRTVYATPADDAAQNNRYDAGTPFAVRTGGTTVLSVDANNHYDVGTPRARRVVGASAVVLDPASYVDDHFGTSQSASAGSATYAVPLEDPGEASEGQRQQRQGQRQQGQGQLEKDSVA